MENISLRQEKAFQRLCNNLPFFGELVMTEQHNDFHKLILSQKQSRGRDRHHLVTQINVISIIMF